MGSFIRINNRNNFLLGKVPSLHPASIEYLSWWRKEKGKIIQGIWSPDDANVKNYDVHENKQNVKTNKWRFMPGNLYFYVNFGTILHNPPDAPKTAPKKKIVPLLRDIEWELFYNWLEARGFSGFSNDDKFTCNREVFKHEKEIPEEDLYIDETCYTKKGDLKKFISARVYLRQLHSRPLGIPLYMNEAKNLFMLGSRGFGKDLIESTLLHYKDDKRPISDAKIGDRIYGANGELTTITDRVDYSDQEQYEVTLADNRKVTSGLGHIWGVYKREGEGLHYYELELKDIIKDYLVGKRKDARYFIPQNLPIEYDKKDFLLDPYIIGSLLGDGGLTNESITFTTADIESVKEIRKLLPDNCDIKEIQSAKYGYIIYDKTHKPAPGRRSLLKKELIKLGMQYKHTRDKSIPKEYLNSSIDQRISLLQGLLDTDGYINKFGNIELVTISKKLAKDVITLSRSLGIVTTINESDYKTRIYLKTGLPVFRLKRKLNRISHNPSKYAKTNRDMLAIRKIENVGVHKSVCISVDNNDSLFIVDDYVVTHNSYSVADGIVLHEVLTDGAKIYDQESIDNPATVEVFVGSAISSKSSDLLSKTRMAFNELPGGWMRGTENEVPCPLYKDMAGGLEPNNMKSPWRHEYEKKVNGKWRTFGSMSNVKHGIFTVENPEAAAGTRPGVMVIEEVGLLPNLLIVHGSNTAAQLEGTIKFGSAIYLGTGGNIEKIIESEIVFRDPDGYDFLSFDDEWEGKGKIGWFVPAYYALNQFKDNNGNTDVDRASAFLERRRTKKRKAKSPAAITLELLSYPIKPSEMFLKKSGNFFPVDDLKFILADLEANDKILDASWKGKFIITKEGKVEFKNSLTPVIQSFPLRSDENMEGCVEIYEMPKRNKKGEIPYNRYIAGNDPVDDDSNTNVNLSLQSTFVLDTFTDRIVAEYTSRTVLAEEYYETLRRLLLFYGARVNYEQNKKGLYGYFKNKKSLFLLEETPQILSDVDLTRINTVGNKKYGTVANDRINSWGRRLILSWLLRDAYGEEDGVMNMHGMRGVAALKELISWNEDINADRVSALIMLMIFRENIIENVDKSETPIKTIADSDFWNKSYSHYHGRSRLKKAVGSGIQQDYLHW